MKKRGLAIIMAGLMAASMSSVCAYAEAEEKTEGFYIGLSNGYWGNTWRAQMVEDFETKAEEYKEQGILSDYMISNTNSDATEQLNQINAMIDSGVDAILIDAVLEQDVMAEGVIKAYENANKDIPVMTGDYTKSFFTKWAEMEDLNTIGVPYAPGNATVALEVAVRLLQGKEIDESNLVANPMDENMINTIMVAPPYVVTKEAQPDAAWMEGLENTEAISLDEAMELLKDSADTAALDGYMSDEAVDKLFK